MRLTPISQDESVLTPSSLDRLPRRGADLFLSVHENHNPQPFLDHAASYLFGPAGQDGGMEHGTDGRGKVREDIYGFWVDLGRGVVVSCKLRPSVFTPQTLRYTLRSRESASG